MKKEDLIKSGDYCKVVSMKRLKKSGLSLGDELLIASLKVLPLKGADPYLQRVYAVGIRFRDDKFEFPNPETEKDNGYRSFLLDPRSLEKVTDERKEYIENRIRELYSDDPSN